MKTKIEKSQCSPPGKNCLPARTIRTFLADDLPLLMALLARIVSKDKRVAIVGSATDGRKALCNASTLGPNLVVTDLHMPGLDGAEVTHLLKQQPNPPIVFVVTSDDTPEARARCMAAGADAFLVKAANLVPQLLSAIQEFFPDDLEPNDAEPKHLHAEWRTPMVLKTVPFFLAVLLLVSGCAHFPRNAPLISSDPSTGYRFRQTASPTNSPDLLLMLAFSGGGTRAAALSYGVLEELARTPVGARGKQHRLLDEVDSISSVSGGSFTAAYYALWGDRIFSDFEPQFLKKHVQTGLLLRALAPWNLVRLATPAFSRSDLAAEYYDHLLFKGATYGDLMARRGRPFLCVNATDVASGARFEFTQDEFDLIRSDLSQFPVSRAVAASSALPMYLTPVTLKNHSAEQAEAEPEWIQSILDDPAASTRMRYVASQARSYTDGHRHFIHLVDGGFSDYLGLRGAIDRVIAREQSTQFPSVPLRIPRRVALIVVDADRDFDYGWDSKEDPLGFRALLGSVGQVTVSHYSFETIELFREVMARLSRERTGSGDSQPLPIITYIINLHFNQLPDKSESRFFNSVPTSLQLPSKTVDRLRQLAARQLDDNVEFKRLVSDLRDQPIKPDSPARPAVAVAKDATQMANP